MFGLNIPQQIAQPSGIQEYKPDVRLKQGSNCPDCGSDKYMTFGSYAVACGECGYHPRFEQSGHGERTFKTKPGEATPARQPGNHQTMQGAIATLQSGGGDHINNL
jgi:ribosomal protein S27AE